MYFSLFHQLYIGKQELFLLLRYLYVLEVR